MTESLGIISQDEIKTIQLLARETKYELNSTDNLTEKSRIIDSSIYKAYVHGREITIRECERRSK